jgi:predicted AlkP superfamily pyrophosphatase or phosphodiesterase
VLVCPDDVRGRLFKYREMNLSNKYLKIHHSITCEFFISRFAFQFCIVRPTRLVAMAAEKNKWVFILLFSCLITTASGQRKAVFIILDGISADVVEGVETPVLDEIAKHGGYTRAYLGGEKGGYSESPTVSAVGYNHVLTGTWSNKHNVYDNDIKQPNYHYWNIFRIAKNVRPELTTAIFSSWTDNRTKLVGEGLVDAGSIKLDYAFDGFELDEKKFPHTNDRKFMFDIDEHVSKEAGRYIEEKGPDLSWVYLEFTDDMGHMYGDSPEYNDAVKKADAQVGRIWKAIKKRQQQYGEQWMIVITTDHGRNAKDGKDHGSQTDRERTTWITTNATGLNEHFRKTPASTDITPSILLFMGIEIPPATKEEMDGVAFINKISLANLKAMRSGNKLELTWDVFEPTGDAYILIATTNHFKTGGKDKYSHVGKAKVQDGKFVYDIPAGSQSFFKILVKAPFNTASVWSVTE